MASAGNSVSGASQQIGHQWVATQLYPYSSSLGLEIDVHEQDFYKRLHYLLDYSSESRNCSVDFNIDIHETNSGICFVPCSSCPSNEILDVIPVEGSEDLNHTVSHVNLLGTKFTSFGVNSYSFSSRKLQQSCNYNPPQQLASFNCHSLHDISVLKLTPAHCSFEAKEEPFNCETGHFKAKNCLHNQVLKLAFSSKLLSRSKNATYVRNSRTHNAISKPVKLKSL